MRQRKGVQIIANSPRGRQIIFQSKRSACRRIGCKFNRLARVIAKEEPILIDDEYYWLDELREPRNG